MAERRHQPRNYAPGEGRPSGTNSLRRRLSKLMAFNFLNNGASSTGSVGAKNLNCSGRHVRPQRSAMEALVYGLTLWKEKSPCEIVDLLLNLRLLIELDDAESQYCRMSAFSVLPQLAELLSAFQEVYDEVSVEILTQALACIRFATKGEVKNIDLATNCGVLLLCKNVMQAHPDDADIQRYCCMVFRSLTFNRADNQLHAADCGAVQLVLKAMGRFHSYSIVQAAALMSIQNITWLVEGNRTIVEHEGGISHILQAMRAHPDSVDVQKWACGALQNLACCVYCTMRLLELDAIKAVLCAMANHQKEATVQNYGLGVLRNISYLRENRRSVASSGAVELAIEAMNIHLDDLEVQNSAISFFFNTILEVDENCKKVLSQPGILPAIFAATLSYSKHERFVEKSYALLDQLARFSQGTVAHIAVLSQPDCPTLQELALCQAVPRLTAKAALTLPENLRTAMACAAECQHCDRYFTSRCLVAYKEKKMKWRLKNVCSRRCVAAVLDEVAKSSTAEPARNQ